MQLPDDITVHERTREDVLLDIELTPQMPCFAGHFERLPVLAAVVQIGWAQALAERYFERRFAFAALRSNKFQQLVRPPLVLTLALNYQSAQGLLKYRYSSPRGVCSRGAIAVREVSGE